MFLARDGMNLIRTDLDAGTATSAAVLGAGQMRFGDDALRIMAPEAIQGTALKENRGANPRSIMDAETLDVEDATLHGLCRILGQWRAKEGRFWVCPKTLSPGDSNVANRIKPGSSCPMMKTLSMTNIERSIHVIREHKVMLDEDLAQLYGVTTGRLNEAVKRNISRFPIDFAFRLTVTEAVNLKSQFATSSSHGGRRRSTPMVFTEQGVAMLSSVLSSQRAVAVNIEIMRAFVKIRQAIAINAELARRLALVEAKLDQQKAEIGKNTLETEKKLAEHEEHIRIVFETIRRLMVEDEDTPPPARIGFKLK